MFDIIIIGAGFSGTFSALKLPQHLKILLIEAGDEVLPLTSSSYNECYKLHTGLHYAGNYNTAKNCLLKSIEFARELSDFIAGGSDLWSPWRRGRHYFMSNSLVDPEKSKEIATQLQQIYEKLVSENEKNKIFGDPKHFLQFLSPKDYPHLATDIPFYNSAGIQSSTSILFGIETAESQIDFPRLKEYLKKQISTKSNITFIPATQVMSITHHPNQFGYLVSTINKNNEKTDFESSSIINCSWQNIEKLDRKVGMYPPDQNRVVRIKVSILVKLPEQLRNMNTCIFSSGPYCSITVLPNGTAVLTSERSTNIGYFKSGQDHLPSDINQLLNKNLHLDTNEGQIIAKNILNECASYLNNDLNTLLRESPILELRVGFVKLIENQAQYTLQSIYEADSVIHSRQQDGIEIRDLGYISNSGMKMTYTVSNATVVARLIEEHLKTIHHIRNVVSYIKESREIKHPYLESFLFVNYRERLKEIVSSSRFVENKEACINELIHEIKQAVEKYSKMMNAFSLFKMNKTKEQSIPSNQNNNSV